MMMKSSQIQNHTSFSQLKQSTLGNRRNSDSFGKIIKNGNRIKTQSSQQTNDISQLNFKSNGRRIYTQIEDDKDFKIFSTKKYQKYTFKSQNSLDKYESKLAQYQKNKRIILRDLGRVNTSDFIEKRVKLQKTNSNKNQQFLAMKLKHSSKLSKFCKQKQLNVISQEFSKISQKKSTQKNNTESQRERQKFIQEIDQQIRLQNKLRKLKMEICCENRKQIRKILNQFFSQYQYDQDKLMKIDYQQFEPPIYKQNSIGVLSPQILSEKLIQTFQMCENHWKQKLFKKYNSSFVKQLHGQLNNENKIELDLKSLAREFNIVFSRNYHPRQLFRIYQRINPFTRGNFIYIFSA